MKRKYLSKSTQRKFYSKSEYICFVLIKMHDTTTFYVDDSGTYIAFLDFFYVLDHGTCDLKTRFQFCI